MSSIHEKILTIEDIQPILEQIVAHLSDRFGEHLISVVLYGSYARGNANTYSDVDIMVAVQGLPQTWDEIHEMEDELMEMELQPRKRLQLHLVSPESVAYSVQWAAPLMLEIYDAHKILSDRDMFFARQIRRFAAIASERGIRKIRRGVWEVPEIAAT